MIEIAFEKGCSGHGDDSHTWQTARAHCTNCGGKAPWCPMNDEFDTHHAMAVEAARLWNERKGGAA